MLRQVCSNQKKSEAGEGVLLWPGSSRAGRYGNAVRTARERLERIRSERGKTNPIADLGVGGTKLNYLGQTEAYRSLKKLGRLTGVQPAMHTEENGVLTGVGGGGRRKVGN